MTSNPFFDHPILNSPYERPARHWELDESGQPTQLVIEDRRKAKFETPIPKPRKRKDKGTTIEMVFDEGKGLSTSGQQYDPMSNINLVRAQVDQWRELPPNLWNVTPETQRLLQHWRLFKFETYRPFFCQIEAVETAIWLTEVAPKSEAGKRLLATLKAANNDSNPELFRLALKLATGAGKTTVMAMLIAWQTINAVRSPQSKRFTRGFLVVTPGLTIRDRLRVLLPNDPDNYYQERSLVPVDLLEDLQRARIVITNYHAFKRRETLELSKGGRALLQGNGPELSTIESEGQILKRVMPELMGLGKILVLNDEAHHCYRERQAPIDDADLKGEERVEAEKNNEAARLWISGLEAAQRKVGLLQVFDLSATPFFLRGSGYVEGTLFPWTVCDFSLMDAIGCGIVKLPRVPVADNIPGNEMPVFRDLWSHISSKMPKKGRGQGGELDPLKLPIQLQTALTALYGHYERTYQAWKDVGTTEPPCFIVVCNNTSTSKLVYDYISGFRRKQSDESEKFEAGRLPLFRNYDDNGNPLARPNTLLIDSQQLESGEAYRDVPRLGRKTCLSEAQRRLLWSIFEQVRSGLKDRGLITQAALFTQLAGALATVKNRPFDHVIVDEAQDLTVSQVKFLAALGGGRPGALFFAGDLGQRIFQQPFSWKAHGIDVRGRSRTLRVCYRTSHQIRAQADRLLGEQVADVDGNTENRKAVSVFNGPVPEIQLLPDADAESSAVSGWLKARVAEGVQPHEIGVFVRSEAQLARARAAVEAAGPPYRVLDQQAETVSGQASISTMHLAKGLEFKVIVVMACDDEVLPLQERIAAIGDEADLQEVYDTERHLLYVACTRARDMLLVTGVEPASEFLGDMGVAKP